MNPLHQQNASSSQPADPGERGPILVLAMGNDILADDGAAWGAARLLKQEPLDGVDILETAEAGLALLELLEGYDQVVLIDSVKTGRFPPGTIIEFNPADLQKVVAPSPHYAGLPEVLALAERLNLNFPKRLRIFAMEVENPFEIREGLSPAVEAALPEMARRVREAISQRGR